jgi:ABC-2 type transport system ATP-binding protein
MLFWVSPFFSAPILVGKGKRTSGGDEMEDLTLLTIDRLNVWYSPGKNVLDNFSLELGDHEIVGLIGLNGAGKTTFIKTLSGLISSFLLCLAYHYLTGKKDTP